MSALGYGLASRSKSNPASPVLEFRQSRPDPASARMLSRRASTGMGFGELRAHANIGNTASAYGVSETYKKLEKLGEGTYATVYKGISCINAKMVALKEIQLEHEEGAPCTAIREVSLLKGLKHANIVTLHDIIHTKKTLTLVFEYLERDLKQYMDDCRGAIEMDNVQLFLYQLLRGLKFCHSRKVLHRDLKPQNLLINAVGELKLADFGLARAKSVPIKTYSNEVVTLWYRPPDVLLGSVEYSTQIDIWGVGCIFSEMVSGRPLFPGATNEEQVERIWKVLGTPTEATWSGVSLLPDYAPQEWPNYKKQRLATQVPRLSRLGLDLLEQLLQCDPKQRPPAQTAMAHEYFRALQIPPNLHPVKSIFNCPGVVFKKETVMGKRRSGLIKFTEWDPWGSNFTYIALADQRPKATVRRPSTQF
eukprot:m.54063 g.54063  ORF g.54063 m.54063 type:complete len:420 (-) comp10896_c1_seq2:58-1317(-)